MEVLQMKELRDAKNEVCIEITYKDSKGYLKNVRIKEYDLNKKSYENYTYFKNQKNK